MPEHTTQYAIGYRDTEASGKVTTGYFKYLFRASRPDRTEVLSEAQLYVNVGALLRALRQAYSVQGNADEYFIQRVRVNTVPNIEADGELAY